MKQNSNLNHFQHILFHTFAPRASWSIKSFFGLKKRAPKPLLGCQNFDGRVPKLVPGRQSQRRGLAWSVILPHPIPRETLVILRYTAVFCIQSYLWKCTETFDLSSASASSTLFRLVSVDFPKSGCSSSPPPTTKKTFLNFSNLQLFKKTVLPKKTCLYTFAVIFYLMLNHPWPPSSTARRAPGRSRDTSSTSSPKSSAYCTQCNKPMVLQS